MGYVGGTLFLTGALLVVVDLLGPTPGLRLAGWRRGRGRGSRRGRPVLLWSAEHLPMPIWGYATGTAAGAVMVTVLVLAGGPLRTATFGVLYVFVSTYGFHYYGNAIAWGLVALNGIGFAATVTSTASGSVCTWCAASPSCTAVT